LSGTDPGASGGDGSPGGVRGREGRSGGDESRPYLLRERIRQERTSIPDVYQGGRYDVRCFSFPTPFSMPLRCTTVMTVTRKRWAMKRLSTTPFAFIR